MDKPKHSIFRQICLCLSILLLLGNSFLGLLAFKRSESALFKEIQNNVKNIAHLTAINVSGEQFIEIQEGEEDTEEYAAVMDSLVFFRDNADVEYIYTLQRKADGSYIFVVDSDPEEPAAIGDACEATDSMNRVFSEGITLADEETVYDEWGAHVSAYSPIFYNGEVVGAVGVDISANWIDEQINGLRNLLIVICVITYIVSLMVLLAIMSRFKRSMGKLNDKVKELAGGEGDLTKEIDIYSKDEFGMIAANMNEFIRQIRSLVREVAKSGEEILNTGEEVSVTVTDNVRIMSDMNEEIGDISADMKESSVSGTAVSRNLSESAEHMLSFTGRVRNMREMVQKASESAKLASATANGNRADAMKAIDELQRKVKTTSNDAQKIQQVKLIAEEIGKIASQTRMLSLNAQIEAARAGSMGAGFTVVAEQVGALSDEIDGAVAEINQINGEVLSALAAWTEASEEMIRFVEEDVVKAYDAFAALGVEYGETTDTIHEQMTEIGSRTEEIQQSISEISKDVTGIADVINKTAESANHLAASTDRIAESLDALNTATQKNVQSSGKLSEQVHKYRFD